MCSLFIYLIRLKIYKYFSMSKNNFLKLILEISNLNIKSSLYIKQVVSVFSLRLTQK